jgi:hypothetical protein
MVRPWRPLCHDSIYRTYPYQFSLEVTFPIIPQHNELIVHAMMKYIEMF